MSQINSSSSWEIKFNAVVEYKKENGKFPTYKKRDDNDAEKYIDILAKWIQYQKEQEVKGKLSNEMKERIETIDGWKWTENSKVRVKYAELAESKQEIVEKEESILHNFTVAELSGMRVVELKTICIQNKYSGYSKLKKEELINFIMNYAARDEIREIVFGILDKIEGEKFIQTV